MELGKSFKNDLETYYYSTEIPLTIINEMGSEILCFGTSSNFCKFFAECTNNSCPCPQTHLLASKQAEKIGEAYIFSCPTGLINFTVPLLENGIFRGAVIAGPFLMDFPDELLADDVLQKFNLGLSLRGKINSYLKSLPMIEPSRVRHLSKLLFIVVTSFMNDTKYLLLERNLKHTQQAIISEKIQDFKNIPEDAFYPYENEKELLLKVKSGDILGAKSILNDLIGYIFFSCGRDIKIIKSRTIELCTLLSRAAIEGGADLNEIFGMNRNFLNDLNRIESLEDLSYWLVMVLDKFTENVFSKTEPKGTSLIQKSILFINENYKKDLTLNNVAELVHLNASYFSTLFKKELGLSFSSYLNKVRVEKSKFLLKNSTLAISDIALEVGFEDQSYFTKVFKSVAQMTPKEYKQKLL